MSRAAEFELIPGKPVESVRFRMDSDDWISSDPASWSGLHAAVSLPNGPDITESMHRFQCHVVYQDGADEELAWTIALPPRKSHLYIGVNPDHIQGISSLADGIRRLDLVYPDAFNAYITKISYHVHRLDDAKLSQEVLTPEEGQTYVEFADTEETQPVEFIEAKIRCSRSALITVPILYTMNR